MRNLILGLLISCFAWSPTVSANLDLSGKTVTWVVPFKEGGGTSRFARFLQPYLTKYLPGNPTIQIQHIPGGGAIKGSNYFQKNAKPDGTYLFWLFDLGHRQCSHGKPARGIQSRGLQASTSASPKYSLVYTD